MSTLLRWLVDMMTFGLVRRMDEDIHQERENLARIRRGEDRIAMPISKDFGDTLRVDPFWRHHRKDRRS